jgi:hypothetical protein
MLSSGLPVNPPAKARPAQGAGRFEERFTSKRVEREYVGACETFIAQRKAA